MSLLRRLYRVIISQVQDAHKWRRLNGWLVILWALMLPLSVFTGWLNIVAYVAVLSIYANFAAHLGVWAASRAEAAQIDVSKTDAVSVGQADRVDVN